MTGPEHYKEAERLTRQARTWMDADTGWKAHLSTSERLAFRRADLAEAQVHATLANAAATAMSAPVDDAEDEGAPSQVIPVVDNVPVPVLLAELPAVVTSYAEQSAAKLRGLLAHSDGDERP